MNGILGFLLFSAGMLAASAFLMVLGIFGAAAAWAMWDGWRASGSWPILGLAAPCAWLVGLCAVALWRLWFPRRGE